MHGEDLRLAKRVVNKDKRAAEEFFNSYFPRLFRFVSLRTPGDSVCEDLVQETLIKAIRHLDGYRGEAALFTWLCQIARNQISDYYRYHERKEAPLVSLDDDPQIRAILESLHLHEEGPADRIAITQIVQLTLDYLPDQYGRALEWKYLEGLTVEEIARRLDTGVVAAQSLLARARHAFRAGFKEVQLEIGAPAAAGGKT